MRGIESEVMEKQGEPRGGVDGGGVDCRGADGAAGESVWVGGGGWSVLEKSEAAANKVLNDQKYRHTYCRKKPDYHIWPDGHCRFSASISGAYQALIGIWQR